MALNCHEGIEGSLQMSLYPSPQAELGRYETGWQCFQFCQG